MRCDLLVGKLSVHNIFIKAPIRKSTINANHQFYFCRDLNNLNDIPFTKKPSDQETFNFTGKSATFLKSLLCNPRSLCE